jgi:hypothetical protein
LTTYSIICNKIIKLMTMALLVFASYSDITQIGMFVLVSSHCGDSCPNDTCPAVTLPR